MAIFGCECKRNCTLAALIFSIAVGVLTACFQSTGVITGTSVFLQVVFGGSIVYLGTLLIAAALRRPTEEVDCPCNVVGLLLIAILGAIVTALSLLAVGSVATSIINAILVGLLLFFFALEVAMTACYVRCLNGCDN